MFKGMSIYYLEAFMFLENNCIGCDQSMHTPMSSIASKKKNDNWVGTSRVTIKYNIHTCVIQCT